MRRLSAFLFFLAGFQCAFAIPYCVNIPGKNVGVKGTPTRAWGIAFTGMSASHRHTSRLSARTFIETRRTLPPIECILGTIGHRSIIIADLSFYHNPASRGFETNRVLCNLSSVVPTHGNQCIKDVVLKGDWKKLQGGIDVKYTTKISFTLNCFDQKAYFIKSCQNNAEGKIDGQPFQEDAHDFNTNPGNTDLRGVVRIVQLFEKI